MQKPAHFVRAVAITKSDTVGPSIAVYAILVQGTGNLKVTTAAGDVVTFTAVPAYTLLPIAVQLVWSTGTTATGLIGLG